MKRLILCLALLLIASPAFAWKMQWQVTGQIEGSALFYQQVGTTNAIEQDAGMAIEYDLDTLGLTPGVRYEFWLRAYTGTPKSYSGDSNHIRWTYPTAPTVIEMLGAPVNIIINP